MAYISMTLLRKVATKDWECQGPNGRLALQACRLCSSMNNFCRSGKSCCTTRSLAALAVLLIVRHSLGKPSRLRFSRSGRVHQFPGPGASFLAAFAIANSTPSDVSHSCATNSKTVTINVLNASVLQLNPKSSDAQCCILMVNFISGLSHDFCPAPGPIKIPNNLPLASIRMSCHNALSSHNKRLSVEGSWNLHNGIKRVLWTLSVNPDILLN